MSLIQGFLSLVSTHNAGGSEINFRIGDNLNVVTVASPDWSEVTHSPRLKQAWAVGRGIRDITC